MLIVNIVNIVNSKRKANKTISKKQFFFNFYLVKNIVTPSSSHLEDQIQALKNEVDYPQQKIIQLEQNQALQIKKALSELVKRSEAAKTIQQSHLFTLPWK